MNKSSILGALLGALFVAGAAQATTLNTTSAANAIFAGNPGEPAAPSALGGDGILQNFTGIDWHQNGAGLVQGFTLTPANTTNDFVDFTLTYQAFAAVINTTSATPDLRVAPPGPAVGTYELTTVATLHERATCLNAGCSTVKITFTPATSSNWSIYFDNSPDANQAAGTGFTDGALMLSGTWDSELSTFLATGTSGTPGATGVGSATLFGTVLFTNGAYVSPALAGTRFDTTLNFPGPAAPDFTRPLLVNGIATGPNTDSQFVLNIDGAQQFTPVPEPATLALVAAGIFGMGTLGRRREQKK
ncbi:MAG: flocculation-associated PEP-CTERM protein PepA [Pseudomonadota bacterium]